MPTYGEVVTRILDDLSRPDDESGDAVRREILSAIDFYSSERFAFNERTLTISFSLTRDYTFNDLLGAHSTSFASLWAIDGIKVGYSSRAIIVEQQPYGTLFDLDNNNINANIPDFWAVRNRTLRLYPTPNTTLSAVMDCHVDFVALAQTGDINPWLTEGLDLIMSRAARMVCQRKLDDWEKASQMRQLEAEALQSLRMDAATLQSTGMLSANE